MPLEEAEVERRLRSGRAGLELVERRLVAEVAVAGGHRALLDLVVDPAHDAPRRRLALGQPHERLDLAREPVAGRAAPAAAGRGSRRPSAACCRAAPPPRRRGCAPWRRVVAAVARGVVEQVPLGQPARRARHPAGGPGGGRHVVAVVAAEVDAFERQAPVGGEAPGVTRRSRRCSRRCRGRCTGRRPRSRGRAAGPTRASESLPPLTATSTRSPGASIVVVGDRLLDLPSAQLLRCSAQKLALWRGRSMIAGPRHTRHFDTTAQPPEITGRTSTTSVSSSRSSPGTKRAVADDEVGLPVEPQLGEQRIDRCATPSPRPPAAGCAAGPSPLRQRPRRRRHAGSAPGPARGARRRRCRGRCPCSSAQDAPGDDGEHHRPPAPCSRP